MLREADSTWWPLAVTMSTTLVPIRPVAPTTTIFPTAVITEDPDTRTHDCNADRGGHDDHDHRDNRQDDGMEELGRSTKEQHPVSFIRSR